jgi:hypothetical protein
MHECQEELIRAYPDLKLRWVRIYGKRWAYLYGNFDNEGALAPLKIQLNHDYGLCLDNSEVIPETDLVNILKLLKERFSHVDLV